MATRFTALADFGGEVDGRKSRYRAGLGYTIRDGNTALAAAVQGWLDEGLVMLGPPPGAGAASTTGSGRTGS